MKLESLKELGLLLCGLILAFVFGYTGIIKLMDFQDWVEKYNKLDLVTDFHLEWGTYLIPFIEISTSLMFLFDKLKKIAYWNSFILMLIFTIYIYCKIYIWEESLCPCGGIFSQLTLDNHFIVNLILLLLSTILVFPKRYISR